MRRMNSPLPIRALAVLAASLALAACTSTPPPPPPVVDATTPAQRMAAVLSIAGVDDKEVSVQPLRDPQVDDLRQVAAERRQAGDLAGAAEALDQALLLVESDPGILQERAEIALLQGDWARAETLARKAVSLGSRPAVPPPLGHRRAGAPGARRKGKRHLGARADRRVHRARDQAVLIEGGE